MVTTESSATTETSAVKTEATASDSQEATVTSVSRTTVTTTTTTTTVTETMVTEKVTESSEDKEGMETGDSQSSLPPASNSQGSVSSGSSSLLSGKTVMLVSQDGTKTLMRIGPSLGKEDKDSAAGSVTKTEESCTSSKTLFYSLSHSSTCLYL